MHKKYAENIFYYNISICYADHTESFRINNVLYFRKVHKQVNRINNDVKEINEKSGSNPHNTASKNQSDDAVSDGVILFVVSAVQFLTPFMLSAVGVALPAIGREFSASAVQLGLVETVYIFAFSLFLLPAGRLGDIYGRKRVFTIGILVFTAGTVLLPLAFTIDSFIVFRFFQGCGGAMISGTSVAILSSVFPPAKRGQAMGIIVACVYLGLSLGPVLSGFMVTHLGWRWIFYLGVLVELFCLCLTVLKLKGEWADARGERFDFAGTLLYIISLFCLIYGTLNQKEGGIYLVFMASGALGFLIFIAFEYRCSSPILDVGLVIRNRVFAFSNLATLINYAASFGIAFFFSLYLQVVRGYSPQWAGWILIIQPVFQMALSPFFGRLADRVSPAGLATAGMALCTLSLGLVSRVHAGTPLPVIMGMLALMGVGFGLFSSPNTTTVMGSVPPKSYGIASSFLATMRTMGMLCSMTIITLVFKHIMGDHPVSAETQSSFLASMHLCMMIFCFLCVAGVFCSMVRLKPVSSDEPSISGTVSKLDS
ncbi:MAG: MFS transporter [Deltaproteobacteria bacterium]|nr:MFS transporter [Deltaproteobacteria bacterium]MBW2640338.1 MFS transporter [Deltaproteobacteria bacterium]